MTEFEKTNIISMVPNSNINTNGHGVVTVLSALFIGNKNTKIQETSGGKHLIHISSSLKGDSKLAYLAKLLNIKDSILDPQYHNTDIRIVYWINGDLTDKRKKYFARNFVQGALVRDVVLEITGYNAKYHQLEAKWLNNGAVIRPDAMKNTAKTTASKSVADTSVKVTNNNVTNQVAQHTTATSNKAVTRADHRSVTEHGVLRMEDLNLS